MTDQNDKTIKVSRKRNSLEGAGVGINTYLETSDEVHFLLGQKL